MNRNWTRVCAAMLALAWLPLALAQNQVEIEEEGRIIRIGPDGRNVEIDADLPEAGRDRLTTPLPPTFTFPNAIGRVPVQPPSAYMIGIGTATIAPELRAQVELPAEAGLLAQTVVEESPAAEAGIKQYDILLKVNGESLADMQQLVKAVDAAGEKQEAVTLDVLRKGESLSFEVKPTKRENIDVDVVMPGSPNASLVPQFFRWRQLGPAVRLDGQNLSAPAVPDGVSISVTKQNDQPTKIVIKRGEETYEIVGDDKEALEKLPEDLRPLAENLLQSNSGNANRMLFLPGENHAMEMPQGFSFHPVEPLRLGDHTKAFEQAQARMEARMAEMEAMMKQLQDQMSQQREDSQSRPESADQ